MVVLKSNQGMVLAAAVMLIIFAAVAVTGVTVFVVQRLGQVGSEQEMIADVYLAQAGIEQAIYNYRFRDLTANGYFSLGQTAVDANHYYVLGGSAADLFMVDTTSAQLSGNSRSLLGLQIQNATNTRSSTLDQMIVTWNTGGRLTRIRIAGQTVWNGNDFSPATALVRPRLTLDTIPTIYPINEIRFNSSVAGANIDVRFVMTDGSFKDVRVYPASNNFNVVISATGKTSRSRIFRTMRAVYNARRARVVQYDESNIEILP